MPTNFFISTAEITSTYKVLQLQKMFRETPVGLDILRSPFLRPNFFVVKNIPNPPGFVLCRTGAVVIRVTLTMIGKAAITYSYTLIYLYTPEIYPTVVRGAGLGVGTLMARLGGVVAPLVADLVSINMFGITTPKLLELFHTRTISQPWISAVKWHFLA